MEPHNSCPQPWVQGPAASALSQVLDGEQAEEGDTQWPYKRNRARWAVHLTRSTLNQQGLCSAQKQLPRSPQLSSQTYKVEAGTAGEPSSPHLGNLPTVTWFFHLPGYLHRASRNGTPVVVLGSNCSQQLPRHSLGVREEVCLPSHKPEKNTLSDAACRGSLLPP